MRGVTQDADGKGPRRQAHITAEFLHRPLGASTARCTPSHTHREGVREPSRPRHHHSPHASTRGLAGGGVRRPLLIQPLLN